MVQVFLSIYVHAAHVLAGCMAAICMMPCMHQCSLASLWAGLIFVFLFAVCSSATLHWYVKAQHTSALLQHVLCCCRLLLCTGIILGLAYSTCIWQAAQTIWLARPCCRSQGRHTHRLQMLDQNDQPYSAKMLRVVQYVAIVAC